MGNGGTRLNIRLAELFNPNTPVCVSLLDYQNYFQLTLFNSVHD